MIEYNQFPDFINDYIYKQGWTNLRDIQLEAIDVILNSNSDVLIASPTASGKTEACLFPIFTKLNETNLDGITCLYISPLKALINDQFDRMKDILVKSNINLFRWHGDISSSSKDKAISSKNSFVQITPESLQALILKYPLELETIFTNLQFIVIDEIHYFLGSVRGAHLSSILSIIQKWAKNRRIIALSATLSNTNIVKEYLNSNDLKIITSTNNLGKVRLLVDNNNENYEYTLYKYINHKKCILFSPTRGMAEDNYQILNKVNDSLNGDNYIYIHHGSISKAQRNEVEEKLKNDEIMTVSATTTLELGIDIGSLERIVQVKTPFSINSMVQRLGRSGRNNLNKEMVFIHNIDINQLLDIDSFIENIPLNLIYNIALIELYIKDKYLEDYKLDKYPYELLFHQTITFLYMDPGISFNKLINNVLNRNIFKYISKDEYLILIKYLIDKNYLEIDNNKLIYLAELGERIANSYHIYTLFETPIEYIVNYNNKIIGKINKLTNNKQVFNLAGSSWIIKKENKNTLTYYVDKTNIRGINPFDSNDTFIFDEVVINKMFELLDNYQDLPYLTNNTKEIYKQSVKMYQELKNIYPDNLIKLDNGYLYIVRRGSIVLNTLACIFNKYNIYTNVITRDFIPFGLYINCLDKNKIISILNNLKNEEDYSFNLNIKDSYKYSNLIPNELLRKRLKEKYTNFEILNNKIL